MCSLMPTSARGSTHCGRQAVVPIHRGTVGVTRASFAACGPSCDELLRCESRNASTLEPDNSLEDSDRLCSKRHGKRAEVVAASPAPGFDDDQHVVLRAMSWQDFEALLAIR